MPGPTISGSFSNTIVPSSTALDSVTASFTASVSNCNGPNTVQAKVQIYIRCRYYDVNNVQLSSMPDTLVGSDGYHAATTGSSTATYQDTAYNALTRLQASKPVNAVKGDYRYWTRGDATSVCPGSITNKQEFGAWSDIFNL